MKKIIFCLMILTQTVFGQWNQIKFPKDTVTNDAKKFFADNNNTIFYWGSNDHDSRQFCWATTDQGLTWVKSFSLMTKTLKTPVKNFILFEEHGETYKAEIANFFDPNTQSSGRVDSLIISKYDSQSGVFNIIDIQKSIYITDYHERPQDINFNGYNGSTWLTVRYLANAPYQSTTIFRNFRIQRGEILDRLTNTHYNSDLMMQDVFPGYNDTLYTSKEGQIYINPNSDQNNWWLYSNNFGKLSSSHNHKFVGFKGKTLYYSPNNFDNKIEISQQFTTIIDALVYDKYLIVSDNSGIFLSQDDGTTWTNITGDLEPYSNNYYYKLRRHKNHIYAYAKNIYRLELIFLNIGEQKEESLNVNQEVFGVDGAYIGLFGEIKSSLSTGIYLIKNGNKFTKTIIIR